ncbi:hypothetical protein V1264_004526 [Littorina saxatilis]|uniref:Uncharacterized protein n=1 Tax=Littorina saxatilis TaxID=31220 RepID=A0AAN9B1L3_9CAEN
MEQQQEEGGKSSWPELLGKTYEEAEATIKAERPDLNIFRVLENSPVTMDYRIERVRITVNQAGVVVLEPVTG